jgi:predicted MFS family arabinose efflux permease
VVVASMAVGWGFRGQMNAPRRQINLAGVARNYRAILKHSSARVCYPAVFLEGCCVLGLFPFVAAFLVELGDPRLSIAGIVIAGFAIGGLVYTQSVSRLLPVLGEKGLMIGGGLFIASQLIAIAVGPPWQVQLACFIALGCGFYMIHGSLQTFVSEISVEARGTAVGLHAFCFFLGQTAGPLIYGSALATFGKQPTLLVMAAVMLLLGVACSQLLWHRQVQAGAKEKPPE